jgi:PAS domain S-box-containing protein
MDESAPATSLPATTLEEALDALRRERARHEAVAQLGLNSLRRSTDHDGLVTQALALVCELLPCDYAALLRVDADTLTVRHASDPAGVGYQLPREGSLAALSMRRGAPTMSSDLANDPRLAIHEVLPREHLLAGWAVPLRVGEHHEVLSCVAHEPWTDEVEGEAFLQAVANVLVADATRREAELAATAGEARFRTLAEHVPDAVFHLVLRPTRHIGYVSPRYAQLCGLPLQELESDPDAWRKAVPPEDLAALDEVVRFVGDEVVATKPYRVVRPDGSVRWVETRVAPLRDADGRLSSLFGATRDITTLQETEAALRRALEREQRAAEELRQVDELKNALLAAVSHELRTPLTSVVGFAELLQRHDHELSSERRQHLLQSLSRNARRLEQLLGDLLDLDRLDRSVIEPVRRPTSISELIARVIARLDATDRQLELDLPRIEVALDAPKVERIVENLLVNAVKHGGVGSRIWIRARSVDDGIVLVVEDDGHGVPDELKPTIFDAFVRGERHDRRHAPGTGIGLSLVARFAELHGGRAWVEDRPGGGAAFHVLLPGGPIEPSQGDLARRGPASDEATDPPPASEPVDR